MSADASLTVVGSGAVIVADATISPGLQALLTAAVSVEDSLGAIVAALSAHVRTLPSLVCAISETDGIRLLLRGSAEALVTTDAGEQRIAPGLVSTWAEHMVPVDASLVLRHAAAGGAVVLPGARSGIPAEVRPAVAAPAEPAPSASPTGADNPAAAARPAYPSMDPPSPTLPVAAAGVDASALASSTLAWLGDGIAGTALPAAALDAPAADPLAPPADAADEPEQVAQPVEDEGEDEPDPFGFRHLLDETMHVSTEEAAVRPLPEDHEEPEPEPVDAAPQPPVAPDPEPDPEPEPVVPLPMVTGGGLIDSVPGGAVRAADISPTPAMPAPASARGGSLAPNATAAVPARPVASPGAGAPFASTAERPPVQAVLCDLGHANPVIASECRSCRHPLVDRTPRSVPRPSLGRLVFTDGMVVELDSPVLIGRAPAESMAGPDLRETPKLISLPSQDKRISRLHAEVRLEGWQVYVLDSSSLNGTTVIQPRLPPRQLRSGEPCLVEAGSSVNLGGAVTFTFEGPS